MKWSIEKDSKKNEDYIVADGNFQARHGAKLGLAQSLQKENSCFSLCKKARLQRTRRNTSV
jgi:hypothetical protein